MEEDESFDVFYAKFKDIVNLVFNLGEANPEPKIVRNVLRYLPRDSMPRLLQLRNQRILTRSL